jgi:hypothetical protein
MAPHARILLIFPYTGGAGLPEMSKPRKAAAKSLSQIVVERDSEIDSKR